MGKQASDWLAALRAEVARTSLRAVSKLIGRAPSTIKYVLDGTYGANTAHMQARVEGVLMNRKLTCPVLGEISPRQCQDEQSRPFAATNPTRIAVYRACRNGCPNFRRS